MNENAQQLVFMNILQILFKCSRIDTYVKRLTLINIIIPVLGVSDGIDYWVVNGGCFGNHSRHRVHVRCEHVSVSVERVKGT